MYRTITRAAIAATALLAMMSSTSLAGATSEPFDPYPNLPTGMAGVDGEITRIYLAVLDRSPDDAGMRYWSGQRQAGVALDTVVGSFRTSPEFETRFASMLDAPVGVWVETMYERVLGRTSDAAGKAYWTDLVDSGASSREALIIHFADSAEYRIKTGTGPEGFAARVEASRQRYAALGGDYRYTVDQATPFDFGSATDLEVIDGAVGMRSYEAWHREDGQRIVDEAWTESGSTLGSHTAGAPLRTIDQLHDDCREELDELDPRRFELMLGLNANGLMTMCGGIDPLIADGPGVSVSISDFTVVD